MSLLTGGDVLCLREHGYHGLAKNIQKTAAQDQINLKGEGSDA
jgi:hypothetical protein